MRFRASEVAAATGGRLIGADVELDGASFDSRSIRRGQLFVPIVAERDGHDFIAAAVAAGAPAFLTHQPATDTLAGGSAIAVADTGAALMALGAWARSRLPSRVVGITGSVGKTSVKDLAAAALGRHWRTAANLRSFNNEQGLPVTLLDAPDDTEAVVLEMGARGKGEIARLCAVGRPTVGVVTMVAAAHTELFGTLADVAEAKGELVEALPQAGVAVLNAGDPLVMGMASRATARILTFGQATASGAGPDVAVSDLVLDDLARAEFTLDTPWGRAEVQLGVPGAHMAQNAAAALAAALVCDVPLDAAVAGIESARLSPWRMELHRRPDGALVLNDAYNANPASMRAALETLASLPGRRRVAVLGLMAELGDAEREHLAIADQVRALDIELLPVGTTLYGRPPVTDPLAELGPLGDGDVVLVKGSRVAGLEALAARLLATDGVG